MFNQTMSDDELEGTTLEVIPVMFRIWMYDTKEGKQGIMDLERNFNGIYIDSGEAKIKMDKYGVFRLIPRERGKDLPERFYSIIESQLLATIVSWIS